MSARTLLLAAVVACAGCGGDPAPGEQAFNDANEQIGVHKDRTSFGNGPEAVKLAERFASVMKVMRRVAFTESKGLGPLLTDGEFLTYCQLTDRGVLFLVHVPELRKFTESAQAALLTLAWRTARVVTKNLQQENALRLGVGLRGALLYGGLAVGSTTGDEPEERETSTPVDLEKFYPFFVGEYPATVAGAAEPDAPEAPATPAPRLPQ